MGLSKHCSFYITFEISEKLHRMVLNAQDQKLKFEISGI